MQLSVILNKTQHLHVHRCAHIQVGYNPERKQEQSIVLSEPHWDVAMEHVISDSDLSTWVIVDIG